MLQSSGNSKLQQLSQCYTCQHALSSSLQLQAFHAHVCRHATQADQAKATPAASEAAAAAHAEPAIEAAAAEVTSEAAEAPPQISKEDRIAAAREKYLARKRQKTGG